jgi:hypothetical protein
MSQLSLAAVDDAAPKGDPEASQWFTPPDLATRIVHWSGATQGMHVLEPSAGIGRLVDPLIASGCHVLAIEKDRRLFDRILGGVNLSAWCEDFLAAKVWPYDLAVMNPPFEDGQAEAHVMRALEWAPRVVALLPAAFTGGKARYSQVWRHVRLQRLVHFTTRPSFGGDSSGSRDFAVFEFLRRKTPRQSGEADMASVEWWSP